MAAVATQAALTRVSRGAVPGDRTPGGDVGRTSVGSRSRGEVGSHVTCISS